jgi:glc operon protein GlcG
LARTLAAHRYRASWRSARLERPALSPSDGNAGARGQRRRPAAVFNDPQLLAMPGGEPVIVDGLAIGGVGISGLPPELDAGLAARFVQRLT